MNHQVQATNVINSINTLPKQNHANLFKKANEQKAQLHAYSSSASVVANKDDIQHHFLTIDKPNTNTNTRPTYGAYTNNTLPRGPYLQYKYNDRQPAREAAATLGPSHSPPPLPPSRTTTATTTPAAINPIRKNSEYFDNNKLQQNRQIEQLKNEFIHLPRARILASERNNIIGSTAMGDFRYTANGRFFIGDNEDADDTVNDGKFTAMVQTLGRYKQFVKRNELAMAAAAHRGVSNLEYFYGDNQHDEIHDKRDNFQQKFFNEHQYFNEYENQRGIVKSKSTGNCINGEQIFMTNGKLASLSNYNGFNGCVAYKDAYYGNDVDENRPLKKCHISSYSSSEQSSVSGKTTTRNRAHSQNSANVVTLADVMKTKTNGLSQVEGWALLCQSVQALQDLFLSDTPSTTRILPLVHPSNLQITSRGRVVFNILPTGQMDSLNDVTSYISFLSPEYLGSMGKKIAFVESDIEKMWIYSLGITLRRTIQSLSGTSNQRKTSSNIGSNEYESNSGGGSAMISNYQNINGTTAKTNQRTRTPVSISSHYVTAGGSGSGNFISGAYNQNINHQHQQQHHRNLVIGNNDAGIVLPAHGANKDNVVTISQQKNKNLTSLEYVIRTMCAPNIHYRASLMYLLDAISQYCRYYHQLKPFSHIAIDLFKEVVDNVCVKKPTSIRYAKDEHKSDTDSGRSSIHGDKDILMVQSNDQPAAKSSANQLKVTRCTKEKLKMFTQTHNQKVNLIGPANEEKDEIETKTIEPFSNAGRLQVKRRKDAILKRRNMHRRNTIDLNQFDMEQAANRNDFDFNFNASKSTNCIDKIGTTHRADNFLCLVDQMNFNGSSMPDLSKNNKFATLPNLHVRRNSRIVVGDNDDDSNVSVISTKSKGPEFILNSSLPCQEIEISDAKCMHRRAVNVLLLNGRSMNITCSSTTTTARQILETVLKTENFVENFFLGLCALIGGDFVFLPPDLKINKVAPQIWGSISKKPNYGENVIFTLFLRIKFFLPNLRGISSLESRHLLYLQLRKSILESQILCTDDDLILLGGLALQVEVGDFKQTMKFNDYFTVSHYLPEGVYQRNKEMAKYLRNSHFCKRGLHAKEAEHQFIRYVQEMKEYGAHLYSAVWTMETNITYDVYVAISLNGIAILERSPRISADKQIECGKNSKTSYQRKLYANFDWLEIENLCFSKHVLCVVVRKSESLKAKDNNRFKYKFKMDGRKSYFAFNLASEHHKFYMKLRDSFTSLQHISNDLNIQLSSIQCENAKAPNIFPSDYEPSDKEKSPSSIPQETMITDSNIKIIDKVTKTSGMRVRNLKKSMLNDNKLIKLRNKLLRRSKSSIGLTTKSADCSKERIGIGDSKEEYQNKENELPKQNQMDECQQQQQQQSKHQQISPIQKLMSPNRNRVKMGTRVFSSQFLNKSFDNIYDNAIDVYHFDDDLSDDVIQHKHAANRNRIRQVKRIATDNNGDGCTTDSSANGKSSERNYFGGSGGDGDGLSLKSTSLSSLYFSEKMSEKFCDSPLPSEAYVIHSSIKSTADANYFSLQNETVSETLLDKFNDMTAVNNSMSDRIIIRITIKKDSLSKLSLTNENKLQLAKHREQQQPQCYTQIKYATLNSKKIAQQECDGIAKRTLLSRSQESLFLTKSPSLCVNEGGALNQFDDNISTNNNNNNFNRSDAIGDESQHIDNGFTLGISIVQGSDNNVYVKDLVENGPGARHGIQIGDQILAVNGTSLLNLPYAESLKLLQNTGKTVQLIVSQIFYKHQQQQHRTQKQQKQQQNTDNNECNSVSNKSLGKHTKTEGDNIARMQNKCMATFLENSNEFVVSNGRDNPNEYAHKTKDSVGGGGGSNSSHGSYSNQNAYADAVAANKNDFNAIVCDGGAGYTKSNRYENPERSLCHEEKFILRNGNDDSKRVVQEFNEACNNSRMQKVNNSYFVSTKSMPDLPKVVAIIPKNADRTAMMMTTTTTTSTTTKLASQSRKCVGPIKYPVTPIRATINGENQRLSLLADDDEQQVYI